MPALSRAEAKTKNALPSVEERLDSEGSIAENVSV